MSYPSLFIALVLTSTVVAAAPPLQPDDRIAPPAAWPVFRGNASGSGIAASQLPAQPELLWTFQAEDSFFEATAAIVDSTVYVGDADKTFYAIDLATGKPRWTYPVEIGFLASAAVADGRVFVGDSDGIFYCLDAATGKLHWKLTTEAEINSSANFYEDSVLFGSQDGTLYRLKRDDGTPIWKYTIVAAGGIQSSPTLADNRAFFCGCDGQLHVINVDTGKPVDSLEIGDPTLATPAIRGDHVYFGTEGGRQFAINWRQNKVSWTYEHPQRRLSYRSSAAVTATAVVVGGRNKLVEALAIDTGKPLWEFAARNRVDSSPVVSGDRVFVGSSDGRLYALDLASGNEVWRYDAGAGFTASPAVAAGRLVIGNDDGVLYCFGKK